jgi:LysM repeat protein
MKRLIVLAVLFSSLTAFAQDDTYIEVVLDGKPALLNTKTGQFKAMNKKDLAKMSSNKNYTASKTVSSGNTTNGNTHTVNRGETLYSISKQYGVSMSQLKSINNLESNALSIGQVLNISYASTTQEPSESAWIVKKGDTLYGISRQSGVSVTDIKALNNLESNTLSIGQQLRLK